MLSMNKKYRLSNQGRCTKRRQHKQSGTIKTPAAITGQVDRAAWEELCTSPKAAWGYLAHESSRLRPSCSRGASFTSPAANIAVPLSVSRTCAESVGLLAEDLSNSLSLLHPYRPC